MLILSVQHALSTFNRTIGTSLRLFMLLYAGMDWASYRKSYRQILVCALVAVNDLEALGMALAEARTLTGLPKTHVFHAYTDTAETQLALLNAMLGSEAALAVGAVIYDSADGVQEAYNRLSVNDFTQHMGLALLKEFLPVHPVKKLVCDSEFAGRKQETKFKKSVRTQRDMGSFAHSPEIEFSVSWKSELIQAADCFGYNLYRSQRDALELPALQRVIKRVRRDSGNIIRELSDLEARG